MVLGCAHPGVVNTVKYALAAAPGEGAVTVVGGMHLGDASDERIDETVRVLRDLGVTTVAPCHCTGERAMRAFAEAFGHKCLTLSTGSVLTLP